MLLHPWQDEVQSAHWHQKQVTVFTGMSWGYEEDQAFALISDSLDHDKITVNCYMTNLLFEMKNIYPELKEVHIFSDGAASQFKNKFVCKLLCVLKEKLQLDLMWHFFATSHGKGAVDGIGGSIKRKALNMVKARRAPITNAQSFDCATKDTDKIKVMHISEEQITKTSEDNKLTAVWENVPGVPGTLSFHSASPQGDGKIAFKPYSMASNELIKAEANGHCRRAAYSSPS